MLFSVDAHADDGYRLWLKYDHIQDAARRKEYLRFAGFVDLETPSSSIQMAAKTELLRGFEGMLGAKPAIAGRKTGGIRLLRDQHLPDEGFRIELKGGNLLVSGGSDRGILYGAFTLLRLIQTGQAISKLPISESPKVQLRMLNHWDNPLGTIERGYAGASLWKWYELPEVIDPRYTDYARANASIGINAVAVNNVNASARFLTAEYLQKVKALADVFRPYGIQVFLSINFASPKILSGLTTSDPLDPQVRQWWREKTEEVYRYIPDFGGFLVKANSEGELPVVARENRTHADTSPISAFQKAEGQEYGRTHADGASRTICWPKP